MALIKCTECGKEVSDKAAACPNCGAPISTPASGGIQQPKVEVKVTQEKKKGSCLKTILSAVVVFFAIIFIIGILSGDDDKKDESETVPATAEAEKPEEPKEDAVEQEEDSEEVSNEFHVGDILETKKVRLSYLSCGEYSDSNMFVEAGEGNKLIYFEFEFENIGDTDTSVGYFDFSCYADGYEAKSTISTADNAMTSITTLSPGRKTSGIVVFEVPQNAKIIEVEYETSFWSQDKAIFLYQ